MLNPFLSSQIQLEHIEPFQQSWQSLCLQPQSMQIIGKSEILRQLYAELHSRQSSFLSQGMPLSKVQGQSPDQSLPPELMRALLTALSQPGLNFFLSSSFGDPLLMSFLKRLVLQPGIEPTQKQNALEASELTKILDQIKHPEWGNRLNREDQLYERYLITLAFSSSSPAVGFWRLQSLSWSVPIQNLNSLFREIRAQNFPKAIYLWNDATHSLSTDGTWRADWHFLVYQDCSVLPPVLTVPS